MDPKFVYYLSAEFLMGRSLTNVVWNLGIEGAYGQAVRVRLTPPLYPRCGVRILAPLPCVHPYLNTTDPFLSHRLS